MDGFSLPNLLRGRNDAGGCPIHLLLVATAVAFGRRVIVAEEDAPAVVVAFHGDGFRFQDLDWGVVVGDLPWRLGAEF
ncbi:hypothetical protein ACLOJK_004427 [Asimina triloba]